MNILYVIAMYGIEHIAGIVHRELGQVFQAHGHAFSVFALAAAGDPGSTPADSMDGTIPVHRAIAAGQFPDDWVNRAAQPVLHYSRFLPGLYRYTRYLRQHPEIDAILVEGAYPFGAIAALGSHRVPKPFIVSVAGGDFIARHDVEYGYGRYRIPVSLMQHTFRRAALLRVTTPLVRDHVIGYGGEADKIAIVPANLAQSSFLTAGESMQAFRDCARTEIRARFGLADTPILLCAGRLLPIKGFDDAVRALPSLLSEIGSAQMVFVGPDRVTQAGSYQAQLTALATELGVHQAVRFIGAVEHETMKQWLGAADVLVVPSVLEGMNRTAVEAAAVGTPTVVTRTAGIGEQAAAAGVGILVEPRQPNSLAQAALTILRDPPRRAAMQAAGPPFAEQFSSRRVGTQLVELCERALVQAHSQFRV